MLRKQGSAGQLQLARWRSNTPSDHDLTVSYSGDEQPALLEVPLQLSYVNQLVTPSTRDPANREVKLRALVSEEVHLHPTIADILGTPRAPRMMSSLARANYLHVLLYVDFNVFIVWLTTSKFPRY